ncbi:ATP-binding protein [Reyranella soli]|uniref:Transcriptional regulator n=1 Tax=Reyranella soli TaxID=1230389 RepID=A0A512NL99_9HYPH|nr:winged helix-turn-helix domain-containing protein [Reyranella soli]GEP59721.1 transcriptional regulator [Reyranella soli]
MLAQYVYEAGAWEVDGDRRELRAHGRPVPIGSRAFEIIEKLAESAGHIVTKDELVAHVWRGTLVEENTLHVHIHAIRKALGPDRTLLKTAAGKGYRLLGRWTTKPDNRANDNTGVIESPSTSEKLFDSNLPAASSIMVGRTSALRQLRDFVTAYRAVTLVGAPGIGKTTLAIELARELRAEFDDCACLVELAPLADSNLVLPTVASTLGLNFEGEHVTAERLAQAIGNRRLLLVLDNCEHVLDATAELSDAMTRRCPYALVLATSREAMKTAGEHVYRVLPLDVPQPNSPTPEKLLEFSAVELFVSRTKALDHRFAPGPAQLAEIASICCHLDGIPLAIEFAAARAATLGVKQVEAGLRNRFEMLINRRRMALPRHRTLRAALDWSYELLSEDERILLRHSATFAGSFTLQAVIQVTASLGADDILNALDSLVTKSLVALDESEARGRWRLLETIRMYALEKLTFEGEADLAGARHASFYRRMISTGVTDVDSTAADLLPYLEEIDNVRAAIDWSFSRTGEAAIGVDLTAAYTPVWLQYFFYAECRDRCETALAKLSPDEDPTTLTRLKLRLALGRALLHTMGPPNQAEASLSEAARIAEDLNDLRTQVAALNDLHTAYRFRGQYVQARAITDRLRQIAAQSGDLGATIKAEWLAGLSMLTDGRLLEGQQHLEAVVASVAASGDHKFARAYHSNDQAAARAMLARALCLQGFIDRARAAAELSIEEVASNKSPVAFCRVHYYGMVRVALMTGDLAVTDREIARFVEAATVSNVPFWKTVGMFLEGRRLVLHGDFATAVTTFGKAFDICQRTGWEVSYPEYRGALAEALSGLGNFDAALSAVDDAVDRAGHGYNSQVWYVPELLRMKGEILLQRASVDAIAVAERCYVEAADLAREQGALIWELRIALSLAHLRIRQNRRGEARQLLAPVYRRFTEGFDTADMKEARSLLDSLPEIDLS